MKIIKRMGVNIEPIRGVFSDLGLSVSNIFLSFLTNLKTKKPTIIEINKLKIMPKLFRAYI